MASRIQAMSGGCPWCGIDTHAHFFPANLPVDVVEEIPGLTGKENTPILSENAYEVLNLKALVAA
jgi:hypothetical protein